MIIGGGIGTLKSSHYKDPPKVMVNEMDLTLPNTKNFNMRAVVHTTDSICRTLTGQGHSGTEPKIIGDDNLNSVYRIRKLTPTECFMLMGFNKEDIEKCIALGVSNSQLYKQAGNSIVTNCIELLFEHLYKAQIDDTYECFDENFTQAQPI